MTWTEQVQIKRIVRGTLLFIVFVLPFLRLFGKVEHFGLAALERRFRGLEVHDEPPEGDVALAYHTARGFRVWIVQTELRHFAPPEGSERRLPHFHFARGLYSYGMLFVPFLGVRGYFSQGRSIHAPAAAMHRPDGDDRTR